MMGQRGQVQARGNSCAATQGSQRASLKDKDTQAQARGLPCSVNDLGFSTLIVRVIHAGCAMSSPAQRTARPALAIVGLWPLPLATVTLQHQPP